MASLDEKRVEAQEAGRQGRMWRTDILLSIKWALCVYVILGSVLTHILIVPELAKSILSLPVWLIVPYFYGELIKLALHRFKIDFHVDKGSTILSLFLGIYSIVVSSFLLDLLGLQVITENLHFVILSLTFVYMTYDTLKHHKVEVVVVPNSYKTDMLAIAFCLLVSLIPALINRSVLAFPYGTIETISIPFEQYQPALRFMAHGYLQHPRIYDYVSLGFCSQLFNIDPLSFIWSASFLMMAIFSVGLFLFASSISRSRVIGLLTALVGSFLNMNVFRDIPTLFRSNIFLYVFLAPALYLSFHNISRKEYKTKDVLLTLSLIGVVAFSYMYMLNSQVWRILVPTNFQNPGEWWSHVWVPSVVVSTAPVLFALLCLSRFGRERSFLSDNAPLVTLLIFLCLGMNDGESIVFVFFILAFIGIYCIAKNNRIRLLLYVFVAEVLVFVLFQHYVIALPVSNPISSIIFPSFTQAENEAISFSSRFEWLLEINMTSVMNAFLVLGIVATVLSRKKENLLVISAFSLALFLYFFPETFAYRFYKEISVMMACVIAVGLMSMFKVLVRRRWSKYSRIVLSTLVIALLIPNLVIPVYQRSYQSLLGQSMVSDYEYSAARWIMTNMPENTLIISDYATMELLAPLSNKMLPVARMYLVQGLSTEDLQVVRYIKDKLSPTVAGRDLWNGQDLFWAPYEWEEGDANVLTELVGQGSFNNGSQKIEVVQGNYSWVGIKHVFETNQDWSNASSMYLNWFGGNTGNKWQIILASQDDFNWFGFDFYDDSVGWKNMVIPLNQFDQVGSPSWKRTTYIAIRSHEPNHETWLLGSIGLNYPESVNVTYSDSLYLRQRIDITDKRYSQFANMPYQNDTVLFILTERTLKWIEQEDINEVWYPVEGPVDPRYVELFKECRLLELVYSNEGNIYIFRVKQSE